MILIWGTKGRVNTLKQGYFLCPLCNITCACELQEMRRWFTFFWLPIFPFGKRISYLECQECSTAFNPEYFRMTDEKKQETQSPATSDTLEQNSLG